MDANDPHNPGTAGAAISTERLRIEPIREAADLRRRWNEVDILILRTHNTLGRYSVGFASSDRCVEAVQRLRFEVFNLELNEGLQESYATGLDVDPYDAQMTHLVLIENASQCIIGTYRVQTATDAAGALGLYAAQEFDMEALAPVMDRAVECGRACLAARHRNMKALIGLWSGVIAYLHLTSHYWLFGCCSITSADPDDGWRAMKTVRQLEYLHPDYLLPVQPEFDCGDPRREFAADLGDPIALPKLFSAYMRLGCRVISLPAIDRAFGTVDFLILMDVREIQMSSLSLEKVIDG